MSFGGLINAVQAWFSPNNDEQRLKVEVRNDDPIQVICDLVLGRDYDTIDVTYPSTSVEVYTYTLSASPVQVIQVTYTNSTKENILKVESV